MNSMSRDGQRNTALHSSRSEFSRPSLRGEKVLGWNSYPLSLPSSYLHSLTTGDQKVRQSCDGWGTPLHGAVPPVMCPLPPGVNTGPNFWFLIFSFCWRLVAVIFIVCFALGDAMTKKTWGDSVTCRVHVYNLPASNRTILGSGIFSQDHNRTYHIQYLRVHSTFTNTSPLTRLPLSPSHLPPPPTIPSTPNPTPTRRKYPIGIKTVLDALVEPAQGAPAPPVRPRHLVHEREVRPVLAVAHLRGVVDHGAEAGQACGPRGWGVPVVDELYYQVHLAEADYEGREEVDAELGVALARELV